MHRYKSRQQAGKILAHRIRSLTTGKPSYPIDTVVLALPRGGVPVAFEIACAIGAPLDVCMVKKIGAPLDPEFAIGAISELSDPIYDMDSIREHHIDLNDVDMLVALKMNEMQEQADRFRQAREKVSIQGRNVILVDDGMATGNSMKVAIRAVKNAGASHILAAVPVGSPAAVQEVEPLVDLLICPLKPPLFVSVGGWFEDFGEVTDRDVISFLEGHRQNQKSSASI